MVELEICKFKLFNRYHGKKEKINIPKKYRLIAYRNINIFQFPKFFNILFNDIYSVIILI